MTETSRIISPGDGSVYAQRPWVSHEDALAAVECARVAQAEWQETPLAERLRILTDAMNRLCAEKDAVAEELAYTMGRPISQGAGEVGGFEERASYMLDIAPQALADIDPGDKPGFTRYIRREPVGVVVTIAPWNFPYMTAVNSIWPALAAGNAVVLKHAQQTILAGERLVRILTEAGLPEDVFQSLVMSHETTAGVMQAKPVRLICFTGSVRGGHAVQQAIAEGTGFPGTGLELGGKDPAYVRADADPGQAAVGIADGAFFNAGQSCCSIERLYIHESVYDAFVDALIRKAKQLRLGDPLDSATTLGPMIKESAAKHVRGQVADAVAAGARALIDPTDYETDGGAYLSPQIVVDTDHTMRLMREESFGPVVGVMKVRSDDEAVELMNDSEFGLTASLWTLDVEAAKRLGGRIETGTIYMNRCDYLDPALAWTGVKNTGRGCTLSIAGYEQLTRVKSFNLSTG